MEIWKIGFRWYPSLTKTIRINNLYVSANPCTAGIQNFPYRHGRDPIYLTWKQACGEPPCASAVSSQLVTSVFATHVKERGPAVVHRRLRTPTMVPATMAAQVLVALQQNQFVTYFDVSASALLCYDYVLTLPDEVDLIWHSRWNAIKVAFLLSRYAAFWNLGVGIYHQFGRNIPISVCSGLYRANGGLIVSGIGLSEIIIIYRTYALWGKKKLVGCTMVLLFVVAWAVLGVYLAQFLHSIEFIPIEIIPPELQGCFVTKIADTLYICWTIALSYETTVMGLTLIKVWQKFRHTSSPLLYLIFRDSTLSYITLLVSSIANVLVVLLGPPEHTFLLAGTQHALHVILSSRIVLNIRRTAVSGAVVGRDHEIIELREIRLDPCANPLY